MTREFDPKKSYLAIKAHEKMLAYAGFLFQLEASDSSKEGVIKISSSHRPYGGGYLTITFIVDTGANKALRDQLNEIFKKLTDESIGPKLGKNFERMVKVSLDALARTVEWYVEEVNLYFRSLAERENVMIEEILMPALESVLPFSFDPVEWWPENLAPRTPSSQEIGEHGSLKTLFKRWFGSA